MKTCARFCSTPLPLLLLCAFVAQQSTAFAQGTVFAYQGRLNDGANAASGLYDFRFILYDADPGGSQIGPILTNNSVAVSGGVFTTWLDFGASFLGTDRWLETAVRTNGSGGFTTLSPRQKITATPYALYAPNAGAAGSVPAAGITGTLLPGSIAPGCITAAMLSSNAVSRLSAPDGSPTNAVLVNTNGLVGIGTTTPAAGLQITTGAAITTLPVLYEVQNNQNRYTNLSRPNQVAVNGSLLAVGGDEGITLVDIANPASPSLRAQLVQGAGVYTNISRVQGLAWAGSNLVVGAASSDAVTIIGCTNPASPVKLAELRNGVGGWNYLGGVYSVAVRGNLLAIAAYDSDAVTLADISNPSAPVLRGFMVNGLNGFTNLNGACSVALSGNLLAIAAIKSNAVTLVDVTDPSNPQKLAELRHGVGSFKYLDGAVSVTLSGNLLAIAANRSSAVTLVDVSAPARPVKLAEVRDGVNGFSLYGALTTAISGNRLAVASHWGATVTLVDVSTRSSPLLLATAKDGLMGADFLSGVCGVAFAGTNVVVCSDDDDAYTILGIESQSAGMSSAGWVGIGTSHPAAALHVVGDVLVEDAALFDVSAQRVALGIEANASGEASSALGYGATASGYHSLALGYGATASAGYSTAVGRLSTASGESSAALGCEATASGTSAIALGYDATASGDVATALGVGTVASGDYSTALGYYSQATNRGCLVWSDYGFPRTSSTNDNSVTMRAAGGYRLFSNSGATVGVHLSPGGGSWTSLSDRNEKENLEAVDAQSVLDKVATLPLSTWNYKSQDAAIRHIGPMAQDFKAAFGVGESDTGITTIDADGVALAAIQGLNEKIEVRSAKSEDSIRELAAKNAALEKEVTELKALVQSLAVKMSGGAQ